MFKSQSSETLDPVAGRLQKFAFTILVVVFGILPLFFIPLAAAPLGYSKVLFVFIGLVTALVFYSLFTLRTGRISIRFPYALGGLWLVFLMSLLSTILSGDFKDAFVGDVFSIHSTAFLGVLALTSSIWVIVGVSKSAVMKMYMLIAASALVLVIFHIVRLVFGSDVLSMGIFNSNVSTPVGGWNDLALFLGLAILLSLVALEQLLLTKWGRWIFGIVAGTALLMLAVINFLYVWVVLALVSLVMLVYTIRSPKQSESIGSLVSDSKHKNDTSSLMLSMVVFVVSVFFMVGSSTVGGFINGLTDISYIEVRPSFEATTEIAKGVYAENAFLGIGSNKFADAWRVHKNEAINTTVFWNTDFNAGSGYIPTFFITTGVLGGVAWLVFLSAFVVTGMRMLFRSTGVDRIWYFIGVSSFVSAAYIWVMSLVYVPGPTILLIAALCTGVTFLAHNALSEVTTRTFIIGDNRRTGFIFTLVVIVVIIGSVGTLYVTVRHYVAAYTFIDGTTSIDAGTSLDQIEAKIVKAYELSNNDVYVRRLAEYQFARMNTLFAVQAPTELQQQQFDQALTNGINAGQLAKDADRLEPANWAVLGSIYSLLVSANVEGAYERALEALTQAKDLDQKNPSRYLALANLEARKGNFEEAKQLTEKAIVLKPNYSDGFFFLTQLAVATGNVEEAAQSARAVISLEPQNPARYYQLGVLESSRGNLEVASAAFEEAVRLDPSYANAMYFLALSYDALGRPNDAELLLSRILELNPGNADVIGLLQQLETNGSINIPTPQTQPVEVSETSVSEEDGVVTTNEDPDTSLVTPVNIAPDSEEVDAVVVSADEETNEDVESVIEEIEAEIESE